MKKKHPEHVNLERWLVSYADFITLLFAFFVVMYAISQADMSKLKKVSASMKAAFASAGPSGMLDLSGNSGGTTLMPFDEMEPPGGRAINLPAGKTNTASDPDPQLQEMKDLLEESVSLEFGVSDISEKMHMQFDSRGLIVRLAAKDFFASGEIDIKPDLRPLMDRIGRIVTRANRMIRLEGHADTEESKKSPFPSSWELSAARAAWLAKYFIQRFDVNPAHLAVAGYGHFRPISEGKDEWSRAKNRRIEIIILNNRFEEP